MLKITCYKTDAITEIIKYFNPITKWTVFEFGRLRSLEDTFRMGDGWSTYQLAINPNVMKIVSMDIDKNTIIHCEKCIPDEYKQKLIYIEKYSEIPKSFVFDFLYIDGPDSSEINFDAFINLQGQITPKTIIAVDDFSFKVKHILIKSFLDKLDYDSIVFGDSICFYKT